MVKSIISRTLLLILITFPAYQCKEPGGEKKGDKLTVIEKQELQIQKLRQKSSKDQFRLIAKNGEIKSLSLNVKLRVKKGAGDSILINGINQFLDEQMLAFQLDSPKENLRLIRKGGKIIKAFHYEQTWNGIPVYGSHISILVQLQKGRNYIKAIHASYIPDLSYKILQIDAFNKDKFNVSFQNAIDTLKKHYPEDVKGFKTDSLAELKIYDKGIFAPLCPNCKPVKHNPKVCWFIKFTSDRFRGVRVDAFVDVNAGEIIYVQPQIFGARDIKVYDFSLGNQLLLSNNPSCLISSCDPDAVPCYNGFVDAYNYFKDIHNWVSWDNNDSEIRAYINVPSVPGEDNLTCGASISVGYLNADFFNFGNGAPSTDLVAHEFAHGVHYHTAGYVYRNQSGAIAEHIADAFAILVGHSSGNDTDWLIKSGCDTEADDGFDFQDPGHYDEFSAYNENVSIYFNSYILSHAFYLMTAGDTFNDITITGVGEERIEKIYFLAMSTLLSSNPTFYEFSNCIILASRILYPNDYEGVTCQIRNAFAAIGLVYLPISGLDQGCDGEADMVDPDDDDDGVPDYLDNCQFVFNPSQTNTDREIESTGEIAGYVGDDLGDACDDDDDNDGTPDDIDGCPKKYGNYLDNDGTGIGDGCEDTDGDGWLNLVDNCPFDANPSQTNTDREIERSGRIPGYVGDDMGDACDDDIDNDGYLNEDDNCPYEFNDSQDDLDGDRIGDLCDDDIDGDHRRNDIDNCPWIPNRLQEDLDEDGVGDVCDPDIDGDGILNQEDNCPLIPNDQEENRDGDNYGDACDLCPDYDSDDNNDLDGDGIGDPCDEDRDNDGLINDEDECPDQYFPRFSFPYCIPIPERPGCYDTLNINIRIPLAFDYLDRFVVIPCDPLYSITERLGYSIVISIDPDQKARFVADPALYDQNSQFVFTFIDRKTNQIDARQAAIKDLVKGQNIKIYFSVSPVRSLESVKKEGSKYFLRIEERNFNQLVDSKDTEPIKFVINMKAVK